jgi:hypothetical protein
MEFTQKCLHYLTENYKNRNKRGHMPDVGLVLAYIHWRIIRVIY